MTTANSIKYYIYSTKAIGRGSYSKVYKGLDTENDMIIAIKIVDKLFLKQELLERVHNEINLLKKLRHKHIVILYDAFEDEEFFYTILEYCAGGDMSTLIRKGRIPEESAKMYMNQMVDALIYLRESNIIHRDLKPQNILLSKDLQTIKLTDFNFAKELYENDLTSTICGTPLYMAPEIIEKRDYTTKSDIWSLGIILYEMVYGINPYYDAENIIDLITKVKNRNIEYKGIVSQSCNDFLRALLERDSNRRISWKELAKHSWLDRYEDDEDLFESIFMEEPSITSPIDIPKVKIIQNYVPRYSNTLNRATKSEPYGNYIDGGIFRPSSMPEESIAEKIFRYMHTSMNAVKDYVNKISPQRDI